MYMLTGSDDVQVGATLSCCRTLRVRGHAKICLDSDMVCSVAAMNSKLIKDGVDMIAPGAG